ncbi:MAG: TetR family transcriptional regulator [Microlunatus sp.]
MSTAAGERTGNGRRYDPNRRDRIIDACLAVIAEIGVDGASHRKIAEAADVPLGSMTYHFTGMHELLHDAFTRFTVTVSDQFEARMATAADRGQAEEAVVQTVIGDLFSTQRDLVLTHELYTLAARDPEFREITNAWMGRSRKVLEQHFDPVTARILDALIEGLTIHRALDIVPHDDTVVRDAINRIIAGVSTP